MRGDTALLKLQKIECAARYPLMVHIAGISPHPHKFELGSQNTELVCFSIQGRETKEPAGWNGSEYAVLPCPAHNLTKCQTNKQDSW